MPEIITFDGRMTRYRCSRRSVQIIATPRKPPAMEYQLQRRIVRNFYRGFDSTIIARRERIGIKAIDQVIRANSRPVEPIPAGMLGRRLNGRAA